MSRLLLDTHPLLWWLTDDPALSDAARDAIANPTNEPLVSAATIWEIAIKRSLGKLTAPDDLPNLIGEQGLTSLPVDSRHVWQVRDLPPHHRDPFDRVLIAQALVERVPIITADPRFSAYEIEIHW